MQIIQSCLRSRILYFRLEQLTLPFCGEKQQSSKEISEKGAQSFVLGLTK